MASTSTTTSAVAAASAALAPVPALAPVQIPAAFTPGGAPLVSDAKALVTSTYPKLCGRFNFAFHGYDDATPLRGAVDGIVGDVLAWLTAMPDKFRTSNHSLSRPKFGLVFVLKHEAVRATLGDAYCQAAIDTVERLWEDCKKDLVVPQAPKDPAALGGASRAVVKIEGVVGEEDELDELRGRVEELKAANAFVSGALVEHLRTAHGEGVASLVQSLLRGPPY